MSDARPIRCRLAACPEPLEGVPGWSFYLVNDGELAFDEAVLRSVETEWGDQGHRQRTDVRVAQLQPGAHAFVWREGDNVEFRMTLSIQVRTVDRTALLRFEFPKLYLQRNLQAVDGLGKVGFAVEAGAIHLVQ